LSRGTELFPKGGKRLSGRKKTPEAFETVMKKKIVGGGPGFREPLEEVSVGVSKKSQEKGIR